MRLLTISVVALFNICSCKATEFQYRTAVQLGVIHLLSIP